jgi:hypothetical protein
MSEDLAGNLLIGAGLAGLGYLAWRSYDKRKAFRDLLTQELAAQFVTLTYADLGLLPDGRHAWHLTLMVPQWGTQTVKAALAPGVDPYGDSTRQDLVHRVRHWVQTQAA